MLASVEKNLSLLLAVPEFIIINIIPRTAILLKIRGFIYKSDPRYLKNCCVMLWFPNFMFPRLFIFKVLGQLLLWLMGLVTFLHLWSLRLFIRNMNCFVGVLSSWTIFTSTMNISRRSTYFFVVRHFIIVTLEKVTTAAVIKVNKIKSSCLEARAFGFLISHFYLRKVFFFIRIRLSWSFMYKTILERKGRTNRYNTNNP